MSDDHNIDNVGQLNFSPKPKFRIALGLSIAIAIVVIGIIAVVFLSEDDPPTEPGTINRVSDIAEESLLRFTVTPNGPYAYHMTGIDYVEGLLDHREPSIGELTTTLFWAKQQNQTLLLEVRQTIIDGATDNQMMISMGEKTMLEIITWSAYPDYCETNPENNMCIFFGILYQQGRFEQGEIDRDEYWLNVKQYATDEVIAEVEGNLRE